MLVRIAEKIIYATGGTIGRIFVAMRFSPNMVTVLGLALTVFVGVLFGMGHLKAGGCVLIGSCLFDSIDGWVARRTGRVTKFGGFFDSSLDRYADMAIYGGLLVFIARNPDGRFWPAVPALIIVLATAAAFLVSYTKARGDLIVGEIKQGYWGRVERLIMLIIGTCIGRAGLALWFLAIMPHVTVIHRMLIVKARLILTGSENPQQGPVQHRRILWWARMSDDGAKVIFPWYLRALFIDYKRGSIPYDIGCAVWILSDIFVPPEFVSCLNHWVARCFG